MSARIHGRETVALARKGARWCARVTGPGRAGGRGKRLTASHPVGERRAHLAHEPLPIRGIAELPGREFNRPDLQVRADERGYVNGTLDITSSAIAGPMPYLVPDVPEPILARNPLQAALPERKSLCRNGVLALPLRLYVIRYFRPKDEKKSPMHGLSLSSSAPIRTPLSHRTTLIAGHFPGHGQLTDARL